MPGGTHGAQLQRHSPQRAQHRPASEARKRHAAQARRDAERAAEANTEALHETCAQTRTEASWHKARYRSCAVTTGVQRRQERYTPDVSILLLGLVGLVHSGLAIT